MLCPDDLIQLRKMKNESTQKLKITLLAIASFNIDSPRTPVLVPKYILKMLCPDDLIQLHKIKKVKN